MASRGSSRTKHAPDARPRPAKRSAAGRCGSIPATPLMFRLSSSAPYTGVTPSSCSWTTLAELTAQGRVRQHVEPIPRRRHEAADRRGFDGAVEYGAPDDLEPAELRGARQPHLEYTAGELSV